MISRSLVTATIASGMIIASLLALAAYGVWPWLHGVAMAFSGLTIGLIYEKRQRE